MRIVRGSKFVLIGDSITDAGRDPGGEPTPWAPQSGLGHGYVSLLNALIASAHPESAIRVVNKGVSGHTVLDLASRWKADVLDLAPDWLSVFIGINDVWRHFDCPLRTEQHVSLEVYASTLAQLVRAARPGLKGLLVAGPYFIEPNAADPMRVKMEAYAAAARAVAEECDGTYVDTQAAMDRLCAGMHPMTIAWDRIHPGHVGHMALARAFAAVLEI